MLGRVTGDDAGTVTVGLGALSGGGTMLLALCFRGHIWWLRSPRLRPGDENLPITDTQRVCLVLRLGRFWAASQF